MLANNNEYMNQASSTIYQLSQEEQVRLQCRAREDYIRTQNDRIYLMAQKDNALAEKDAQLTQKDAKIAELESQLQTMSSKITELESKLQV